VISVVIPVKDGGEDLVCCLKAIAGQRIDEEVEVVVVDSGSSDGSTERARGLGARVHEITPQSFNHGATRNLGAELASGHVLVFTTQDAYAADDQWLATLVTSLRTNERIAGVYGRQLPHDDATPPERYFLDFLYGPEASVQTISDPTELTFERTLFSNVNAAIPKAVWSDHRFDDDLIMSEDQAWSRRMLLDGWEIAYEPRAVVRHSHTYTVAGAFRRFFDSGVSAERSYMSAEAQSRAAIRLAARRYALGEVAWLWRTGQRRWIPYAAIYEVAKFGGLQLGVRHHRVPRSLKRHLSALPAYWDRELDAGS